MFIDPSTKGLWGFHPMQEAFYLSEKESKEFLFPARVTFSSRDHCRVLLLGDHDERHAKVRGRLLDEKLAVGDWVTVENLPGDHRFLPIHSILPRLSALKRAGGGDESCLLVANVTYVCLVTSFNKDFSPRRIERGIAMVNESQAKPIVVINKQDLVTPEEAQGFIDELQNRLNEVEIFSCSSLTGAGLTELTSKFRQGETITFLGMSGVGKSTLINQIMASQAMATTQVRLDDDRGRHTTTHRQLFLASSGFWLIDSPGIREFSIAGDEDGLKSAFDDIEKLASSCRFGNCSHISEPDCSVRNAIAAGDVSEDRWRNYLKMKREIEHQLHRKDKAFQSVKRKERVRMCKSFRQRLKEKGRK